MTTLHDQLARLETERLTALLRAAGSLGKLVTATGRVIPLRGTATDKAMEEVT